MKCINCSKDVMDNKAIFFLQVYLCSDCADKARALRDRTRSEMENILAAVDDVFRACLVEKKLDLPSALLSFDEVISMYLSMYKYCRSKEPQWRLWTNQNGEANSKATMLLPANTVDGSANSPKP